MNKEILVVVVIIASALTIGVVTLGIIEGHHLALATANSQPDSIGSQGIYDNSGNDALGQTGSSGDSNGGNNNANQGIGKSQSKNLDSESGGNNAVGQSPDLNPPNAVRCSALLRQSVRGNR